MRKFLSLAGGLALAAGAMFTPAVAAEEGAKEKWTDKIEFAGDLRLRYEGFDWDGKFDDGSRNRFRFRLRAGLEAHVRENVTIGFQLRSGNPDNPQSDNETFDGGSDKKTIAIAEAYVDWKAHKNVSLIGGKFTPKSLWHVSDLQWDDDVAVEGSMQSFEFGGGDGPFKNFEANTYQFILEESSSGGDAYMLGFQARPTFRLGKKNELMFGVGYDSFSRPDLVVGQTSTGGLDTEPGGIITNLVDPTTGELISDFRIANAFVVWKNEASKRWPVKVSLFYYKNTGASSATGSVVEVDGGAVVGTIASGTGDDNDTALYGRVQVGDYKEPGHVAIRFTRYDSEPDALFYAFVQSDTVRGSNADANRLDVRVGMPGKDHVNVTWYRSDWTIGDDTTMDRWQVDYIFKF